MSQQKKIIKRSGVTDNYKPYKIQDAISKAFKSESVEYDKSIFVEVVESLEEKNIWAVEEIQDLIEKLLFKHNYFSVMRSFMLYRYTINYNANMF
jgi:ribonucleoside-triphosphate reductase